MRDQKSTVSPAGFFPAALSLVGDWYPRKQLQSRISSFYVVGVFSGAFGGALAYAIDGLNGKAGLASWRWYVHFLSVPSIGHLNMLSND